MQRKFFRKISQNTEYVKTHCNGMDNPLNFAIRNWIIKQQIDMVIVSVNIFEDLLNDI